MLIKKSIGMNKKIDAKELYELKTSVEDLYTEIRQFEK